MSKSNTSPFSGRPALRVRESNSNSPRVFQPPRADQMPVITQGQCHGIRPDNLWHSWHNPLACRSDCHCDSSRTNVSESAYCLEILGYLSYLMAEPLITATSVVLSTKLSPSSSVMSASSRFGYSPAASTQTLSVLPRSKIPLR